MNKKQNVIFDGIILENLKADKRFDSRNRAQIVRPRLKVISQKLKKKIQAVRKSIRIYCWFEITAWDQF